MQRYRHPRETGPRPAATPNKELKAPPTKVKLILVTFRGRLGCTKAPKQVGDSILIC
jgi:hypothetical protein